MKISSALQSAETDVSVALRKAGTKSERKIGSKKPSFYRLVKNLKTTNVQL